MCGADHWSSQPCGKVTKSVTPAQPVTQNVTPRAPDVTKRVTQGNGVAGDVTKRVTDLEEIVCCLISDVERLKAVIDAMRPRTAAERKQAERERARERGE